MPNVFPDADALLHDVLQTTPWRQEDITLFGKRRPMPRLTCWMGDAAYVYSGLRNDPAPWSAAVTQIRDRVETLCDTPFNGVLLNRYRDGSDSMGWHADDEASLGAAPVIASVSLGATRRMRFKKRRAEIAADDFALELEHGSVLIMRGRTQADWLHAIPKTKRPVGPRINLTFRAVIA